MSMQSLGKTDDSSSEMLGEKPNSPRAEDSQTRLYLRVIECKGVGNKPKNYFVSVSLNGKETWRSNSTKKSMEWDEIGRFLPIEDDIEDIKISLFIKGLVNEKRGSVIIKVQDLTELFPYNRWFQIERKEKEKGDLHLQLMLLPPNEEASTELFDSPLHTLIHNNRFDLFEKAVDEEFTDYEIFDKEGRTALHLAVQLRREKFIILLLRKLAKDQLSKMICPSTKQTPLHYACLYKCSKEIIKMLLNHQYDVSDVDFEKKTCLHLACESNYHEIIDFLVEKGAKVSALDNYKNSPLIYALINNSVESVEKLLKHNPVLDKKNNEGLCAWEVSQRRDLVNMTSRKVFMSELNVHDAREFLNRKEFEKKILSPKGKISIDYLKSTQFTVSVKRQEDVIFMITTTVDPIKALDFQTQSSFAVVKSIQGKHCEPDFSRDAIAFASGKPLKLTLEPNFNYNIIPFAKSSSVAGSFELILQGRKNSTVKLGKLKPWKYSVTIEGKWTKKKAGGAQPNSSWINNPQYEVTFPKENNFRFAVYLAQEKDDVNNRVMTGETARLPHDYNIGFYILDRSAVKTLDGTDKWSNARGVHKEFVMDFSQRNHCTILPCTMNPGEESNFTLKLFSDSPISHREK